MADHRKVSNAMGGKTARPCDGCLLRRARWFCPADDAFLCQACNDSIHMANQLASRHERVRLSTASTGAVPCSMGLESQTPTWHRGFTRKARTPRHAKTEEEASNPMPLVPALEGEETETVLADDPEDHLYFRVPVLHEFDDFFSNHGLESLPGSDHQTGQFDDMTCFEDEVGSFLGSEFRPEKDDVPFSSSETKEAPCATLANVKVKEEEASEYDRVEIPAYHWNIEFPEDSKCEVKKRSNLLRLDYDAVMNAWVNQGSPWTTGSPAQLSVLDAGEADQAPRGAKGREARVLRYKEKRRTRLFSKKIRYEVRKLNAEKRPRLQGRFVKRKVAFPYLTIGE